MAFESDERGSKLHFDCPWNGGPVEVEVESDLAGFGSVILLTARCNGHPFADPETYETDLGFGGVKYPATATAEVWVHFGLSLEQATELRSALDREIRFQVAATPRETP